MIWMGDAEGNCLHLNHALREFWGVPPEAGNGFDWRGTVHPEDQRCLGVGLLAAMRARERVRLRARYRDASGEYRILETEACPRHTAGGAFLGMIGVNTDVTEREVAERALRMSEQRFRRVIEAAPNGMLMTDADGRITLVIAIAESLLGYPRDALIGRPVTMLVPERLRDGDHGFRLREPGAAEPQREFVVLRGDGAELPVEIGVSPLDTPDGTTAIAAIVDISGRKRADAQRDLLLAELNHRVKNTLAVVQAIARQTFRHTDGMEERQSFEGRLAALAAAHDQLTRETWDSAALACLAADTLRLDGADPDRLSWSGPPVMLPPRQAVAITLALHELLTNALKYGAFSNDAGKVRLVWLLAGGDEPRLRLAWTESGGPPVSPPTRRGFGSRMIEQVLAGDCEASVTTEYPVSGLTCVIEMPLPPRPSV
jgi:PAS domain S-box-containing protein